jgi:hypothetical protein
MSRQDKGKYALNDPSVINIERQRDAYYQSPDYAQYQKDLSANIKGYQGHQPIHNPIYDAFPEGNSTYQTAFGNTQFDGNQAVADYHYWKSLDSKTQNTEKHAFAANHPWVYDGSLAEAPYQQQIMQQQWDSRPKGQTAEQFKGRLPKNANFAGVDENGKIIPAYDPTADPIYQASPQLRSAALAYTAFNEAKNTSAKHAILAQYPDLVNLWQARSEYFAANPIAQDDSASGLGINFAGDSSGGGGGYGGYKKSNYGAQQFLYDAMNNKIANTDNSKAIKNEIAKSIQGVLLKSTVGAQPLFSGKMEFLFLQM